MNEEIFYMYLYNKSGLHCGLKLPAPDWALLDALERLRLQPGEQPKWSFCSVSSFEFLKDHISPNENPYALNALTRMLAELGNDQRMEFEGIVNTEIEKGQIMALERIADIASSILCSDAEQTPALPLAPPDKPGYVFRISLGSREGSTHTELELPAAQQELDAALGRLGVHSWADVVFREEDSALPCFLYKVDLTNGIEPLNELAEAVRRVDSAGQLNKFNAVLEAFELMGLKDALDLEARLDEYCLKPKVQTAADVVLDWLRTSVDAAVLEELLPYLNCYKYAEAILNTHSEALTGYGLLSRCDGQTLYTEENELAQGGIELN